MDIHSPGDIAEDEVKASLGPDDLRSLSLSLIGRAIRIFSMFDEMGNHQIRRDPPPLRRITNHEEEAAALRVLIEDVILERPLAAENLEGVGSLIQQVLDSKRINSALASFEKARKFVAVLLPSQTVITHHQDAFKTVQGANTLDVVAMPPTIARGRIGDALDLDITEQKFVASVMQMCMSHRDSSDTAFTPNEEIALERAYSLLDQGVRLPKFFRSIDHTADRYTQTYISFADPGDGHLTVTVRKKELLEGLIVHIEYIDRDGVDDKDRVEAYRLPAIRNAARLRLHVGDTTPCTAFIGRPVFEAGDFDLGLLKAGHTMASVCSAMFSHGIADCKVAMDGMSARQAVDFMRVVAGNVVRDPIRQRLSAAFNLNTPLKDDLTSKAAPRLIKDRFEIAKFAIRLAVSGRFNKIAWDGASNERPSPSILVGQLSRVQLLELVHAAHTKDLETYISAGMKPEHLRDAVFAGVGGVGIGTSLHYLAADNTIGEIAPAKVVAVLEIQKNASAALAGRCARELALMDWEYAQRRLAPALKATRYKLFEKLSAYLRVLDDLYPVSPTPQDGDEVVGNQDLILDLRTLLDEVVNARARLTAFSPTVASGLQTRSRAFSDEEALSFDAHDVQKNLNRGHAEHGLGLLGDLATGIVQVYKTDPEASEFAPEAIANIEAMIANGDREGLTRLYSL